MTRGNFSPTTGPRVENLTQRYELFKVLQKSHVCWMHATDEPSIRELHRALADQFQVVIK